MAFMSGEMAPKKPARTIPAPQFPNRITAPKPTKVPPGLIPDRVDGQPVSPKRLPPKKPGK